MSNFSYEYTEPVKETIVSFIINCPYRDSTKIRSLIKQKFGVTLSKKLIEKYIPKLNNFNENKSKKKYQYKIIYIPHTYVGDIFFPVGSKVAFLIPLRS